MSTLLRCRRLMRWWIDLGSFSLLVRSACWERFFIRFKNMPMVASEDLGHKLSWVFSDRVVRESLLCDRERVDDQTDAAESYSSAAELGFDRTHRYYSGYRD